MPCIVCKKDRASFLRIPLEVFHEAKEHYYRSNYFHNFEYDHVCRYCNFIEFFRAGSVNLLGVLLNFVLRGWLVVVAVVLAFAAVKKYPALLPYQEPFAITVGVFVGLVLGVRFVRYLFWALGGLGIVVGIAAILLHSDHVSFLPDVTAMAEREQMKRKDGPRTFRTQDSSERSGSSTEPYDPIQASIDRKNRQRQERIDKAVSTFVRYAPFDFSFTEADRKPVLQTTCKTLGIYFLMVWFGAWMFGSVARQSEAERKKRRR